MPVRPLFSDFAPLHPSAFLCLHPYGKSQHPRRTARTLPDALPRSNGCAALCSVFGLSSNSLLPAIVLVSFWSLRWRVTPSDRKPDRCFCFISAMMAVCSAVDGAFQRLGDRASPTHRRSALLSTRRCWVAGPCCDAHRASSGSPPCSGAGGCCGSTAVKPLAARGCAARLWRRFSGTRKAAEPRRGAGQGGWKIISVLAVSIRCSASFCCCTRYRVARSLPANARRTGKTSCWPAESRRYMELQTYLDNTRRLRYDFRQHLHDCRTDRDRAAGGAEKLSAPVRKRTQQHRPSL